MTVLMLHYHLRPGGVSTVIRRQVSALSGHGLKVHVLTGESPVGECESSYTVSPELAYDPPGAVAVADTSVVDTLATAIRNCTAALDGTQTLLHVHNATIRKNAALLPALSQLASEGYRILLQVHDLAEDWRPDVYASAAYPSGCWWAAINRRDQANLSAACNDREVFFLPNPVFQSETFTAAWRSEASDLAMSERRLFLYPVRGIRRKNLGEALLLSLFLPAGLHVGITLPPANPKDIPAYEAWRAFAAKHGLPLEFDLGLSASLDELYRSSRAVISTSVKEGFGLSFLEPLARGRPVLGRSIPNAINDFKTAGLDFSGLYESITVPDGLYDHSSFTQRLNAKLEAAFDFYGLAATDRQTLRTGIGAGLEQAIDFGKLDEVAQAEVLSKLAGNHGVRNALVALNPWLATWWTAADVFEEPAQAVLANWTLHEHGKALLAIYQSMQAGYGLPPADKELLLRRYLRAESLFGVGL